MKLSTAEERLRRESPAYQPDAGWDELEPQGMHVVMSVRLDARSARRVSMLARETGRSPSGLIRDWTLERIASFSSENISREAAVRETAAPYFGADLPYEELRHRYRPDQIDILLVGESRPAGGTFFYLANSNLYYATHEAFQTALGPMPPAEEFLRFLQTRGVWLYDLASTPVDRLAGRPRRSAVQARVGELADLLGQARPRLVVAIKKDLAPAVRQALEDAELSTERLRVLPFPLYQWRETYVRELARLIEPTSDEGSDTAATPTDPLDSIPAADRDLAPIPPATQLLESLVGRPLRTMNGSPNRILRISGDKAIVSTDRSPAGKPVPVADVQYALDELLRTGDLTIDVATVGHRSAFIGAVLSTLPGVEASIRPRRIRLGGNQGGGGAIAETYGSMKMDEPVDEYLERTRGR